MPANGMNTGTDYAISYYDGNSNTLVPITDVQTAKITAMNHMIASTPFNQPPRRAFVPDGYKIDFSIVRTGSVLEDLAVLNEANFNNGVVQSPGVFTQTVTNPDGSISRYQYTNFVVFLEDHGDVARDKPVTQSLTGYASTKTPIT